MPKGIKDFQKGQVPWNKGRSWTEAERQKISEATKASVTPEIRALNSKAHKGMVFVKKVTLAQRTEIVQLYEGGISPYRIAEQMSCSSVSVYYHLEKAGTLIRNARESKKLQAKQGHLFNPTLGRKRTDAEKQKISEATKAAMTPEICAHLSELGKARVGELSSNWRGGRWIYWQYPYEFEVIKPYIRERDNYMCRHCGATSNMTNNYNLDVHHRNGNRFNNNEENLITLCRSCHKIADAKLRAEKGVMRGWRLRAQIESA